MARASVARRAVAAADATRVLAGGRLRTRGAVVFGYHDVGDDPANTTNFYVSPARFRAQLEAARAWGLRFVDLSELTERLAGGGDVDGLAAVAFDDSLVGVHHHAMPILLELEIPATVFAVTQDLGSSPPWWPGAARMMTQAELAEMAVAGFRIAAHTWTHPSLPALDDRALRNEVAGSRAFLEDVAGDAVDLFAYPFGHYDRRVREEVAASGYCAAYSFLNGRVTVGLDLFRLPRLAMSARQGRARLAYHLARPAAAWPDSQREEVAHEGPPRPQLA